VVDVGTLLNLLAAIGGLGGLALIISIAYWLSNKFTEINYRFKILEKRFDELDNRVSTKIEGLANAFINYQEFFVEFLTREGIVKPIDKELLVREVKRVLRLATTNPLTKEEWDKLRLYLDKSEKDELTPEEADELLELSRKVVREYSEYSEAWKLHIYATIVKTLTIMKYYEKGIR